MTPEEYKQAALRTENTPMFVEHARRKMDQADVSVEQWNRMVEHDQRLARMIHAVLGMITELGELCDPLKRHLVYGAQLDTKNMVEERGDQEWYGNLMNDALDAKLVDIWERNIAKLRVRFPGAFTNEQAVTRDLAAEQRALNETTPGATSLQHRNDSAIEDLILRLRAASQIVDRTTGDLLHEASNWVAKRAGQPVTPKRAATNLYTEHHIMGALTRIAHRLGVDAPNDFDSSVNKRIADMCIERIDETETKLRAFRNAHVALAEAAK